MDIFTIRQQLRTTRLSDIPLRVTFYARVSTDSDEQLNSLDNQIGYYRDYITRNPAWTFIDGYIDEGLSGMTTRKRDNFQRMVQDAKDDKFDLILTKEITRFARQHARQHSLYARAAFRRRRRFLPERQHQHLRRGLRAAPHHHVRHCAG